MTNNYLHGSQTYARRPRHRSQTSLENDHRPSRCRISGPFGAVADAGRETPRRRNPATARLSRGLRSPADGGDRAGSSAGRAGRENGATNSYPEVCPAVRVTAYILSGPGLPLFTPKNRMQELTVRHRIVQRQTTCVMVRMVPTVVWAKRGRRIQSSLCQLPWLGSYPRMMMPTK